MTTEERIAKEMQQSIENSVTERLADLKSGVLAEELTRMLAGYLTGKPAPTKRPSSNMP